MINMYPYFNNQFMSPYGTYPYTPRVDVDPSGYWDTTFGVMHIVYLPSTNPGVLSGTWRNGTVGYFEGKYSNNRFDGGYWQETPNYAVGRLIMDFSADGMTFSGSFNTELLPWLFLPWNGTKRH